MTTDEMKLPASLHYVTFPSLHETPLTIAARLSIPAGSGKRPAVLILHGSAGPSAREVGYADVLNAAGFITLEPDQWAARGLKGGAEGRPKTMVETVPDVYGARAFLAAHPLVDVSRIGVMGFSFGGVASMLAATHKHNDAFLPGGHFAAFMPFYPAAWTYNRVPGFEFGDLVDAPLLLVTGALDQYDNDPHVTEKLVAGLSEKDRARITLRVMADAHHCFDMPGVDVTVTDPFGNQGKGGSVTMRHNPAATAEAHRLAVDFFSGAMKSA
ncbi:MAG: dienelactone hydrolase family protein [Parvibaculum sp.]|uniref:dienelactone hydrolase family protein n=1 Tax=Parvibaculum sp. TaxID=2024848 RepID=UPI003C78181E